jgi:hypothetical protein
MLMYFPFLIKYLTSIFYFLFRYREAKTKFIFDPESGNVELEQKLPMSWHAFNETPKFEVSTFNS